MQITDRRFEAPRDPQSVLEIVDWAFRAGLGAVRPRPDGDICSPISNVRFTSTPVGRNAQRAAIPYSVADGAVKLSAEMVHVAKAASVRDLCQRSVATDHQRLSMG